MLHKKLFWLFLLSGFIFIGCSESSDITYKNVKVEFNDNVELDIPETFFLKKIDTTYSDYSLSYMKRYLYVDSNETIITIYSEVEDTKGKTLKEVFVDFKKAKKVENVTLEQMSERMWNDLAYIDYKSEKNYYVFNGFIKTPNDIIHLDLLMTNSLDDIDGRAIGLKSLHSVSVSK